MDDSSIPDEKLQPALRDLRRVNRLLGGYRASSAVIEPLMQRRSHLNLLDVGTGSGDHLVHLVRRGHQLGCHVKAIGIDLNPDTVRLGQTYVDASLSPTLRPQVTLETGDALDLPYAENSFDIAHAALVLHHFHGDEPAQLMRELNRVSHNGIVINDLHRHPLAYAGIWLCSRALRLAPMVRHDAPRSVRRGFFKSELRALCEEANLDTATLQWHWAFRWTVSTIAPGR